MKKAQFEKVMKELNLTMDDHGDISYKGYKFAVLYDFGENEYLVHAYGRENNLVDWGSFKSYTLAKIGRLKKEMVETRLQKMKKDFK